MFLPYCMIKDNLYILINVLSVVFEVLTAKIAKRSILLNVTPCKCQPEEHIDSIFRVED
jgi:hypothetical protein